MSPNLAWIVVLLCTIFVVWVVYVEGAHGTLAFPRRSRASTPRCPNPRAYFRNGVAKLRFRSRVVKYICFPGYTLIGEPVATCFSGRWDRPTPICAAPGCRLPSPGILPRGNVEDVQSRGMLLLFRCRLGYVLQGSPTAYCDGRSWNSSLPKCVPAIANPELSCDFEDPDQCGWKADLTRSNQFSRQHRLDDLDTAENITGTGGHFMAVEFVGQRSTVEEPYPAARLFSPVFKESSSKSCFRFWYRLPCTLCSLRLLLWTSNQLVPLWSVFGPRPPGERNLDVPIVPEEFQLVFEARPSRAGVNGVAVDNVRLETGECEVLTTSDGSTTITLENDFGEITTEKETDGDNTNTPRPATIFSDSTSPVGESDGTTRKDSSADVSISFELSTKTTVQQPDNLKPAYTTTSTSEKSASLKNETSYSQHVTVAEVPLSTTTAAPGTGRFTSTSDTIVWTTTTLPLGQSHTKSKLIPPLAGVTTAKSPIPKTEKPISTTHLWKTTPRALSVSSAFSTEPPKRRSTPVVITQKHITKVITVSKEPRTYTTVVKPITLKTTFSHPQVKDAVTMSSSLPTTFPGKLASNNSPILVSTTKRAATITPMKTLVPSTRFTMYTTAQPTRHPKSTAFLTSFTTPSITRVTASVQNTQRQTIRTKLPRTTTIAQSSRPTLRSTKHTLVPNTTATHLPIITSSRRLSPTMKTIPASGGTFRARTITAARSRPTQVVSTKKVVGRATASTSTRAVTSFRSSLSPTHVRITGPPMIKTTSRLPLSESTGTQKVWAAKTTSKIYRHTTTFSSKKTTLGPSHSKTKYTTKPTKATPKMVGPKEGGVEYSKNHQKHTMKTNSPHIQATKSATLRTGASTADSNFGNRISYKESSSKKPNKKASFTANFDMKDIPQMSDELTTKTMVREVPQHSASVSEEAPSWGTLAFKVGLTVATSLVASLLVLFGILTCRKRSRRLTDDVNSEMTPLSKFENCDFVDT